MLDLKCIGCGYETAREKRCTCPQCGYTMYALPYQRADLLRDEIVRFVDSVMKQPAKIQKIVWDTKDKDDKRFPDFQKIQAFACSAPKTETFISRLREIISQLSKYINTPLDKTYIGDSSKLVKQSNDICNQLVGILPSLTPLVKFPDLIFPEIRLHHCEYPDSLIVSYANDILEKAELLTAKILAFIKRNSIYGKAYATTFVLPKLSQNWTDDLHKCCLQLDEVQEKKYQVDILEDGTKELNEMLKVLWNSIYTIMKAPVFSVADTYIIGDETELQKESFIDEMTQIMTERIKNIVNPAQVSVMLSTKPEEEVFLLYNTMLELDKNNVMKLQKGKQLSTGNSEDKLNALIGLESVKVSIQKLKAYSIVNQGNKDFNLHMSFCGNPGTGKTEVARIIAGILHEIGLLPTDHVVETDRSGLVAAYVGQTALKTMERIEEAMGGVLFIDEAYALTQSGDSVDYGYEAVATLIKAMEDHRGKFCVILAGYRNQIQEMIASNPGFASRIQFRIDFPNYSREELKQIAADMLKAKGYTISEEALERVLDITDYKRKNPDFANARELRNILDQVMIAQNLRCMDANDRQMEVVDVNSFIRDAHLNLPTSGDGYVKRIMTADEELDALTGLSSVKRMIKKIKAYAKRNKNDPDFNLHMCFYGNPGTGKTEVARLLSRILYEAGVLPEAKLTETDANGLIGKYAGETAPKTLAKINDAMGGVLFIDEAYSLTETSGSDGHSAGYGEEAIAVLLKEMEDRRGQFCVILAGYRKNMESMLSCNPGMKSRIQFQLDFPDYTRDELKEIAASFLQKKNYEANDDAMQLILDITDYYRKQDHFANARTVRNILDQVIMNQNLRTEDADEQNNRIEKCDVEDYIADENIDISNHAGGKHHIGFS